mgnify:CR=1 FL=1
MKKKDIRQKQTPSAQKTPRIRENIPGNSNDTVSWRISGIDYSKWSPVNDVGALVSEVRQKLISLEGNKWSKLLTEEKKKIHPIPVSDLNKCARDRLDELEVELEKIYVIHINGTHCIYGQLWFGIFTIFWYDTDHGDNDTCVCRSRKNKNEHKNISKH